MNRDYVGIILGLVALCLFLAFGSAQAATNLVWSCPTAGGSADSCNASASWNTTGAVLACDTDACSWGAATWRTRSSVPSTRQTLTCINDVAVGSRAACGANYSGERWLAIGGTVTPPPPPPDPDPPVVDPPGPAPTGFARLTWVPPTQNTDDSPLTNLTGYRISYGLGTAALTATIDIDNPAITAYDISGLAPGVWYFGLQSVTPSALSAMSTLATKTILADEPPPPAPIDCAVSAWSAWTGGTWSACEAGTQTRQETRTRTVLTQPSNGGAACPALTETRTASQACTVVVPPISLQCTLAGQSTNYANGDERFTLRCPNSGLNRLDSVTVTRP